MKRILLSGACALFAFGVAMAAPKNAADKGKAKIECCCGTCTCKECTCGTNCSECKGCAENKECKACADCSGKKQECAQKEEKQGSCRGKGC